MVVVPMFYRSRPPMRSTDLNSQIKDILDASLAIRPQAWVMTLFDWNNFAHKEGGVHVFTPLSQIFDRILGRIPWCLGEYMCYHVHGQFAVNCLLDTIQVSYLTRICDVHFKDILPDFMKRAFSKMSKFELFASICKYPPRSTFPKRN